MFHTRLAKFRFVLLFISIIPVKPLPAEDLKDSNNTFDEKARIDAYNLTNPQEHPYAVLLISDWGPLGNVLCSGTLLTMEWVLTAAHCMYNQGEKVRYFTVYAGVSAIPASGTANMPEGAQIVRSTKLLVHPKHIKTHQLSYDTALIKVKGLRKTTFVNSINMSTQPWTNKDYVSCEITAFGILLESKSDKVDKRRKTQKLLIRKPCVCDKSLKILLGKNAVANWICSKPMEDYGICSGDSGGGLVCGGRLVGVASFTLPAKDYTSCDFFLYGQHLPFCGSKDVMSVFIDSCHQISWVYSVTGLNRSLISPSCRSSVGLVKLYFPIVVIQPLLLAIQF